MSAIYTLDKFFDGVFSDFGGPRRMEDFKYQVDSSQYYQSSDENGVTIEMPLAGVSKEGLRVNIEERVLTIEATPTVKSALVKPVNKSWSLADNIDIDNIVAKLENGLLTITLPRIKHMKRTVSVLVS
jgi:HSP20 family molecular chaperone IbpA